MARDRSLEVQQAESEEAGGHECSRGNWCAGRKIVTDGDGKRIIPAPTYSEFCQACRDVIAKCLGELPEAYDRLQAEIGEPVKRNSDVKTPLGPSLPLRADVDAAMRDIEDVLASWDERIRTVCSLSALDTANSRRRDQARAVRQYVAILQPRLNVLFAMAPEPMIRFDPGKSGDPDLPILPELGGAAAGEEILRLHYRARAILGEIRRQAEVFEGVPCKMCDDMGSLERAEPPSNPEQEAMWSRCSSCQHTLSKKDFDAWVKWYAGWAERAALTCRQCMKGEHPKCSHRTCGHANCGNIAA